MKMEFPSCKAPLRLGPIQKLNLTIPLMTPKLVSYLLPGGGGHHDNFISFWKEVLY